MAKHESVSFDIYVRMSLIKHQALALCCRASSILCYNLLNHSNTVLLADQDLLLFQGLLDRLGSLEDVIEFLELQAICQQSSSD